MDFEIIETQEDFDEKVKGILEENTKTVTDTVKKQFKGYISPDESAKLNQQIAELTAKNKAFETSSAKMKIAFENGIPFELAEKLSGETEEEIKADAEKLAGYINSNKQPSPKFSPEIPVGDSQKTALLSVLKNLNKN